MDDSRRSRVGGQGVDAPGDRAAIGSSDTAPALRGGAEPDARPGASNGAAAGKAGGAFIGQAMKSLFESSDVSIRRDDETRVMSRAQDAIADLERRKGIVINAGNESATRVPSTPPPSTPPGPRVDVVLWVVLAVGLFAIAGWMLLYGL